MNAVIHLFLTYFASYLTSCFPRLNILLINHMRLTYFIITFDYVFYHRKLFSRYIKLGK